MIGAVFLRIDMLEAMKLFTKNGYNISAASYSGVAQNIGCINSITSKSGVTCDLNRKTTQSNLTDLLVASAEESNVKDVSLSQLEYEIVNGFKLKLIQVSTPDPSMSVISFIDKIGNDILDAKQTDGHLIDWRIYTQM